MSKPKENPAPNEDKVIEVSGDLDEVHAQTIAELQDEMEQEDGTLDTPEEQPEVPEEKPEEPEAPEEKPEEKEEPLPPAPVPPAPEPPVALPEKEELPVEPDTDTSKPGKDKVAIKDYNGTQFYFNNLDEVPDDFEPQSYKTWARAVQQFSDKAIEERKAESERAAREAELENTVRVERIKKGWQDDIAQLDKDKALPTEQKDRQTTIDAVFSLMNEELAKGRILDFAPAFEIYQFRNGKDEAKERADQQAQEKKDRGSRVQGAGSGSNSSGNVRSNAAGRIVEAPPSGVSLDDIHSSVLGSL